MFFYIGLSYYKGSKLICIHTYWTFYFIVLFDG